MKTKLITPFQLNAAIKLEVVDNPEAAERWKAKGYVPVECCFGPVSVVDDMELDHHGKLSGNEGVAIRAYRDFFGACRKKPKFVTTGFPDEDATWAMCALAGILPHPSMADLYPDAPPAMKKIARQNLIHIAEQINEVDINPDLAPTLVDSYWGRMILSWRQQAHPTGRDWTAWIGGIDRWRTLLTAQSDEFVNAAAVAQGERLEEVDSARRVRISENVLVVDYSMLGNNSTFYQRSLEECNILVAFIGGPDGKGACSFVAKSFAVAEELLGKGGFIAHYESLSPGGCGGRENIGGSSRNFPVTWDQAIEYGKAWSDAIADQK